MMDTVTDAYEEQERYGGVPEDIGALSPSQFRMILQDCRQQPPWRAMADKCADYYDDNQIDQDTMQALERKGMGAIVRNVIKPIVNVVLGVEAKTRSDWRVLADDESMRDVAEALSAKLHEAERETRADYACSEAYKGQIISGLHWVEVSRSHDPFSYPYRVVPVHRREIWWDWRDDSADLSKARFILRKRWFDADQAAAYFPEHAELLLAAVGDPLRYDLIRSHRGLDLAMDAEQEREVDIDDYEQWRNMERRRICLYEVWYRIFVRGWVAKLPNGEVIEIDTRNPIHAAMLAQGALQPQRAVYSKLRFSIWAGPHKLHDCACQGRNTPYVPFWGYREDRTGVPYGLVRTMISPQDEVNARLQKMMWLLGAKRVLLDSDALDTSLQSPQDMLSELSRADAVIFRNPNRRNADGIQIDDNLSLADAQFRVLQDAMQATQQVVGVFNALLGRESNASSGYAINSLVEQGMTVLAEINDKFRYARRLVGEQLLALVREDMIGQRVDVMIEENGRPRIVALNVPLGNPQEGENGAVAAMQNDVRAARVRVALDDVPSTPTYRQQQFVMLAEMVKGLPPQLQAAVVPFVVEASDLQKRKEIADTLRRAMGQAVPRSAEEERQMAQAQQQAAAFAQEVQQRQIMAELAEREAKIEQLRALAEKTRAEAQAVLRDDRGEEFQRRAAEIEANARKEIDRLSAELMTVRMNASVREQRLLGELGKAMAALKASTASANAEIEKARIEREIAEIEAERDKEVARIQADTRKVVEEMAEEMARMREELLAKVEQAPQRAQTPSVEVVLATKEQAQEPQQATVEIKKVDDNTWVGTKRIEKPDEIVVQRMEVKRRRAQNGAGEEMQVIRTGEMARKAEPEEGG